MIEKLLNLLFRHIDIINHRVDGEGELYLRRWFLYPRNPPDLKMVPRLYLHKFYTGDSDRHLHDHPWPFRSLILKGGYTEYSYNPVWLKWKVMRDNAHKLWKFPENLRDLAVPEPPQTVSKWYGPGSILKRGAAWAHSVKLKTQADSKTVVPCWSLVWTGVKCRSWGFHTESGWCWWRNYKHGACVCYDNPNEELYK